MEMVRQIALVAVVAGFCLALVGGISLAPGCYNVPQPACGFFCGANGECPDDYTCSSADHRCHLNGSPAMTCFSIDAGPVDVPDGPVVFPEGGTPPSVITNTPGDNATGVSVIASVSVTFNEEVQGVSGTTFLVLQGATPVAGTVVYTGGSHFATFAPAVQFAANTPYTVTLGAGITDLQGFPLVDKTWTFTTGADTIAPTVTTMTPTNGATNIPVTSAVTARFDEPVIGVSTGTFTLEDGAATIGGFVSYNTGTRIATFTPNGQLPGSTLLTATLTTGITDGSSNPIAGAPVTWTFTTAPDTVPPAVQTTTPSNGLTNVSTSTTISVVFDEPVQNVDLTSFTVDDGTAVAGTLASAAGGRIWELTPSAALASAATVTVTLTTAITDVASNPLAAPVTFTFTTQ